MSATRRMEKAEPPYYYIPPERLLSDLGIEEPGEIRIEAIAQHCGATILYEPLEGSAARILGYRQKAVITVDSSASVARQRFSAAHELGHWMWDRGKMAFACAERQMDGEWSKDNPERRANRYAEELLLPERLFRRAAEGLAPSFASIQSLAYDFQTSLTATAIRFVELSSRPVLLVSSERGKRRWYARSASVPWTHRVLRDLAPGSRAAALTRRGEAGEECGEAQASHWLELREGAVGALPETIWEDSFRGGAERVLSLLTW